MPLLRLPVLIIQPILTHSKHVVLHINAQYSHNYYGEGCMECFLQVVHIQLIAMYVAMSLCTLPSIYAIFYSPVWNILSICFIPEPTFLHG